MMTSPLRNYCFTLHFNGDDDIAMIAGNDFGTKLDYYFQDPCFRFVCGQLEQGGNSHRVHFQGYLELSKTMRFTAVKKAVKDNAMGTAHIEERECNDRKWAIDYCKKTETRIAGPWTYGNDPVAGRPKISLDDVVDYIQENPLSTQTDIADKFPHQYARHASGINALLNTMSKPLQGDDNFVPRPWQQKLLDIVTGVPHDRHIHWITDYDGGCGKSRLAMHLELAHGAIILSGQVRDMCLAYKNNMAPIVIFDISRAAIETSDHLYTMAENLKNGSIFNSKYESRGLRFKAPHVIFFSNVPPLEGKWSRDRCQHVVLSNDDKLDAAELVDAALEELFADLPPMPDVPADAFW